MACSCPDFPPARFVAAWHDIADAWDRRAPAFRIFLFAALLIVAAAAATRPSIADPVKAGVVAKVTGGYARLIFSMSDYDDATVRQAGNVLIITFKTPVDVTVDRLATQAADYIGAARRDPDGKAVRLALARKVTVNAMPAGEKLFVDLLPDNWRGLPPGLPEDVVEALARRARDAQKNAEHERLKVRTRDGPPVRVRLASEPTFTRYVFGVPHDVTVASERTTDHLTLSFDAPVRFELGDVQAALPPAVGAVTSQTEDGSAMVRIDFRGKVEVRTFRDEDGYVVDVLRNDLKAGAKAETAPPPAAATAAAPNPAAPLEQQVTAPAALGSPAASPASPAAAASTPAAAAVPPASQAAADAIARLAARPMPQAPAQPPPQAAVPSPPPAAPPPPAQSATPNAAAKAETPPPAVPKSAATSPSPPPPPSPSSSPAAAQDAKPSPPPAAGDGKAVVELARRGADLTLSFDFAAVTAAAMFHRADTVWLVFDSKADVDLSALKDEASRTIRSATLIRAPDADIVRIKLDRPRLSSVAADGRLWTVEIGDTVADPTHALDLVRNMAGPNRSTISIRLDKPHALHRILDPEAGDQLLVVTAFGPARGIIHEQDFVEFRALATEQGVVVQPLSDDINVGLAPDKVMIGRPGGLTLSGSLQRLLKSDGMQPQMFDSQLWGFDRRGPYFERQSELIDAAAQAPETRRLGPRLNLARFYLAREMYAEAKGVLDVVLAEHRPVKEDESAIVLRAVAEIMMNRPEDALQDLDDPVIGDQHDAPLWRALAYARQGKWAQARHGFRAVESAIASLPVELQRVALKDEMRAAIEVGDYAGAENELNDLETIGVPRDMQPAVAVLIGRLDQGLGRTEDALAAYRVAADSADRPAAAQGELRETVLRYTLGDSKRDDVISELESLTTVWRGDETEIEALQILARLYTEEGRYRDSFYVMRSAVAAHPDWDMTRRIQEEAARTFDALFLAGKGDSMSAIDALALFYDFRQLTPIGSRGDDMIRRLADRLVSVDLLDQAAGLLQYQVDNRLQGAARAEVAMRLAVIYLMDRKPDRALATLQATRLANPTTALHNARLLLEARALSDIGRRDLALEVIASVPGREAIRLRSDIYWAAQRWREAAEQIELLYGDRWKQWQPLNAVERSDILRAEIGYSLADDSLGLGRFRDKYTAKMAGTPDARAFEIVSAPIGSGGEDFKDIAHAAAAQDTLDDFLRDMKAHYPGASPISTPDTADTKSADATSAGAAAPVAASPQSRPAASNGAGARDVPPTPGPTAQR